jgi:uncharacterized membrane protein
VNGIIQTRCSVCHVPGGAEPNRPYQTYAQIAVPDTRRAILTQVYACRMPPAGALPLTTDERQALLAWLVCGGPNN